MLGNIATNVQSKSLFVSTRLRRALLSLVLLVSIFNTSVASAYTWLTLPANAYAYQTYAVSWDFGHSCAGLLQVSTDGVNWTDASLYNTTKTVYFTQPHGTYYYRLAWYCLIYDPWMGETNFYSGVGDVATVYVN